MTATLKMMHKAIGVEVRRGTSDILVDGQRAGSLEMNDTIEIPVEPGRHTLQIRGGRNSSRTQIFEAAESQTVALRCTGKSSAVWVMVPVGDITAKDRQRSRRASRAGGVIIDGGNSYCRDDIAREEAVRAQGIQYVDVGTSGGVWASNGALNDDRRRGRGGRAATAGF